MAFNVDEKWILESESALKLRFPKSFRVQMQLNNGGLIEALDQEWELYPIFDKTDRKRIARTCNDIVSETSSAREWVGFPDEGVAIASNGSGDQLVFLPSKADPESLGPMVHCWAHETMTITEVASDFHELQSAAP